MANVANPAPTFKNEVHLSGLLVEDPIVRRTSTGKAVANFSVGTKYLNRTEYHRIVAWEQQAEKAGKLARKGDFVKVVGRLQTRSWEDKETKRKMWTTEVVAWTFVVPDKEPVTLSTSDVPVTDEDIPF